MNLEELKRLWMYDDVTEKQDYVINKICLKCKAEETSRKRTLGEEGEIKQIINNNNNNILLYK